MCALKLLKTAGSRIPTKVLVIGGSYAGLAASLNLLDLCQGRPARFSSRYGADKSAEARVSLPVEITIVDERDGYCEIYKLEINRYSG